MNIGTKTTYWQFIQEHGITIPVIQRDYAQGRDGKEVLRHRLLNNIKSFLDLEQENKDNRQELILDFVYGMASEGNINPLDGQQRLTTLWLLHWYLLLKSGTNGTNETSSGTSSPLEILSKFTYETRLSSREFCKCLCNPVNFNQLQDSKKIRKDIENQTWFMAEWKQDPTVKAMLNMLGGESCIEEIFDKDHQTYWDRLTNPNCPVKFYYLSLDGEIAQRPDDIYIKMNARGEHLTDFENFKADLIKYIRDKEKEPAAGWNDILPQTNGQESLSKRTPALYLSECLDSTWIDVFWDQLNNKSAINYDKEKQEYQFPNIDKQLFAFLNRYFLNYIFAEKDLDYNKLNEKDQNKIDNQTVKDFVKFYQYVYGDGGAADTNLKYTDFDLYGNAKIITCKNFKVLINVFDKLKGNADQVKKHAKPYWNENSNKEFAFFPQKNNGGEIISITQPQRVVFYGICRYLENCNDNQPFNGESFSKWMRFVWNMARNSDVQTVNGMIEVIKKIKGIPSLHDIIEVLTNSEEVNADTYIARQWNEEIKKARIYNLKKENIIEAEKTFHGSISFLLDDNQYLLEKETIQKAKNLIYDNKEEYKKDWMLSILPYISENVFNVNNDDYKYRIELHEKHGDVEKIINRDNVIKEAVREHLKNSQENITINEDSWKYPLCKIIKGPVSLFDYSDSKIIRKYQCWPEKRVGIYLYKTSQWKQEQCILLKFEKAENDDKYVNAINEQLKKRNEFILREIIDGYSLAMDDEDKFVYKPEDKHLGRSIILKQDDNRLYCGVNGYYINDTLGNQIPYPNGDFA